MKAFITLLLVFSSLSVFSQTVEYTTVVAPYAGISVWAPDGNFNQGINAGGRIMVNAVTDGSYGYHFTGDANYTSLYADGRRQRYATTSVGVGFNNASTLFADLRVTYLYSNSEEDVAGLGAGVTGMFPEDILGFKPFLSLEGYAMSRNGVLFNLKVGQCIISVTVNKR